jgi:hypothetical protein
VSFTACTAGSDERRRKEKAELIARPMSCQLFLASVVFVDAHTHACDMHIGQGSEYVRDKLRLSALGPSAETPTQRHL